MNKVLLTVSLGLTMIQTGLLAADTPNCELSVSKKRIVLSEPVRIALMVSNPTGLEYMVPADIPTLMMGGITEVAGPGPDAPFRKFVGGVIGTLGTYEVLGVGEQRISAAYVSWKGLREQGKNTWAEVFPEPGIYRIRCEMGFAEAEKWKKGEAVGESVYSNTVEIEVTPPGAVDAQAREYLRSHEIEAYMTEQCLKATQQKPDFSMLEDFLLRFPGSTYSPYVRSTLGWLYYGESREWTNANPNRQPEERDRQWARKAIPLLRQCAQDDAYSGRDDAKYWLALAIYESDRARIDEAGQFLQQAVDSGKCRHETDAKMRLKAWKDPERK